MTHEDLVALDHQYTMQTYGRYDVDIDHGKGATLWDLAGKAYIDFAAGIGVNAIGTSRALACQTGRDPSAGAPAWRRPSSATPAREGNEGLIKLARKYSFDKYGKGAGHHPYPEKLLPQAAPPPPWLPPGQEVFTQLLPSLPRRVPLRPGGEHGTPCRRLAGHDVCAVLLELVQGEGGRLPHGPGTTSTTLAVLSAERDWAACWWDEVQTGIGPHRHPSFAFQQYGIIPDGVSFAKGIARPACPWAAFLVNERVPGNVLGPGTHASHLRRQPGLRRRRPGGAGHPGRGRPGRRP